MDRISIIIPCYNEQECLPFLYESINKLSILMKDQNFEFIFVDDGSCDETLSIILDKTDVDSRVKYLAFTKNFGKEAAMYAGLINSKGDYVVIIDADIQHPIELIQEMYSSIINEGYDCVAARRINRKGESIIRSLCTRGFYRILNTISNMQIADGESDFRLMTRQMVDAILSMEEYNRFSKGIFSWVGFKTKWIDYKNIERIAGNSKWSYWNLLSYSIDGIMSFSTKPLKILSLIGIILCILSFVLIAFVIIKTLIWGDNTQGWPSLACIIMFIGGIQIFLMSIIGQYLSYIYLETKKDPYI